MNAANNEGPSEQPRTIQQTGPGILPEQRIEFSIDQDTAHARFEVWLKDSIFAPKDVISNIQQSRLSGVYCPAWKCYFLVNSQWRGKKSYKTTKLVEKREQNRRLIYDETQAEWV